MLGVLNVGCWKKKLLEKGPIGPKENFEFSVGFLALFTGLKRRKMATILCAKLRENQIFTKKNGALPSTCPAVAEATKGKPP